MYRTCCSIALALAVLAGRAAADDAHAEMAKALAAQADTNPAPPVLPTAVATAVHKAGAGTASKAPQGAAVRQAARAAASSAAQAAQKQASAAAQAHAAQAASEAAAGQAQAQSAKARAASHPHPGRFR